MPIQGFNIVIHMKTCIQAIWCWYTWDYAYWIKDGFHNLMPKKWSIFQGRVKQTNFEEKKCNIILGINIYMFMKDIFLHLIW